MNTAERWGYTVEKVGDAGYVLTGPKGGIRMLLPLQGNPGLYYVTDKNMQASNVKGNYTWSDQNGELRPVYAPSYN